MLASELSQDGKTSETSTEQMLYSVFSKLSDKIIRRSTSNKEFEDVLDESKLKYIMNIINGKLNDEYCPNGAYTYTIIAYDFLKKPHSRTGSFLLIR